ncbi:amino acid adenylation domain-containing protein [Streptomyces sp. NBC_00539]|uniref:amino acid adenylation domain-containing protein n=1 Tax=Streptomyces sp. NBC_00539 TaxID=2975770 RepID=UPI002E822554|nr:amino acid adenylation domain-containing protein [Streptomyces sp. NBC_00539]WUC63118.1 amino acid adenylation domain-containing protein [Streptomyces sp. NBC_00539]
MPARSLAGAKSLVEAFAETVTAFPERDAVRCGGRSLTYRQLNDRVNVLASAVLARGGDASRPVGVLLERSADMVAAAVAVLRTGSSYVPLDPATPPARLALILEDAAPSVVITSRELARSVPAGIPVVYADGELPAPGHLPETTGIGRDTRAYIIFTSGTTGRPKGVQVSHGNVLRLFHVSEALYDFTADDVWSLFHTFAFDVSVWEMWGALLYGGCVVVVEQEVAKDPRALWELLKRERVTMMSQTPTAFNQLIAEDAGRAERLPLRRVVLAGEALHFSDLRPWVAKYGDAQPQLINQYGPTETTVYASYRRVREADLAQSRSLIGGPLPDLAFLLVDEEMREVPPGETGELVVTGPGVTQGYLASPELNRERFVELPGGAGRGYRTGDLVQSAGAGDYAYLGRKDDQVKIRGYRVEPGEVEGALRALDSLGEAAVTTRDLPGLGTSLIAYVVPRAPGVTAVSLREQLSAALPPYMLPSVFIPLDSLPMTQNGKLDRRALPDPDRATVLGEAQEAEPQESASDTTAVRIAGMIAELLNLERANPTTGFFQLGGHSLVAITLLARVRREFGVDVPLRDFLREPTAAALAEAVRNATSEGQHGAGGVALVKAPAGAHPPATDPQRRLYFLAALEPESAAYNLHQTVLMRGDLDAAALGRAFGAIVDRHAPLRTVLRLEGTQLVQVVRTPGRFTLRTEALGTDPGEDPMSAVRRLSAQELARPFDLEQDDPLRVRLVRISEGLHALLITAHHVASDGWSNSVLSRELVDFYAHFKQDAAATDLPLAPLSVEYGDYAYSMDRWADSGAAEQDIDYWQKRLEGLPVVHGLPLDKPRPRNMTYAGGIHEESLATPLTEELRALGHGENATPFTLLQALFAVLLARRSGDRDIVVGSPVANRRHAELEGVIGMFVNSVVLRTHVDGDLTFRELLGQVRERTLHDLEHQHVPFDHLVKRLKPEHSAAHSPLFQIMFAYQNNEAARLDLEGLEVTLVHSPEQDVQTDLVLDVLEAGGGLTLRWRYNTDLFHSGTVREMAGDFGRLLRTVLDDPDAPVSTLTAAPRGAAGDTGTGTGTVHGLFPLRQNPEGETAVFALPGVLGLGASYVQLSAHFGDRSFYALSTRAIAQAQGAALSIDSLAGECARIIDEAAAGRRIHLVGHSYGGALSPYVADALRSRGVRVESLVVLDALTPAAVQRQLATSRTERLQAFLGTLADLFPGLSASASQADPAALWTMPEDALLDKVEELLGPDALELLGGGLHEALEMFVRMSCLTWPAVPSDVPPVLLIEAAQDSGRTAESPREGWERITAGGLSCASVDAGHESMLRHPGARDTALLMQRFFHRHDARLSEAGQGTAR